MKQHRPGQWPITAPVDLEQHANDQGEQHIALSAIQARWHVTLGAIRADLEEQPSPMSVRTAARRWAEAVTAMAEEIATQMRNTA
jgi:hypothetical protein